MITAEATPTDAPGLIGTLRSSTVTIANTAPTVTLSGANNLSPNEGSTYTYNYSISDPDGDTIASVATSCGTGTKSNASNTDTSGSFDCKFADGPASTSVSAQATDSGFGATAGNTATQPISVQNVAPTVAISGNASVNEGSSYSLTLGAVTDPGSRHGLELRRALGRRQHEHLLDERCQDAHLRRRAQRLHHHRRPGRRGRHVHRANTRPRSRSTSTTSPRRSRSAATPA